MGYYNIIEELGYELVEPQVLKAIFYKVPQKENVILVGIRKDFQSMCILNIPTEYILRDALKVRSLYNANVPNLIQNISNTKEICLKCLREVIERSSSVYKKNI